MGWITAFRSQPCSRHRGVASPASSAPAPARQPSKQELLQPSARLGHPSRNTLPVCQQRSGRADPTPEHPTATFGDVCLLSWAGSNSRVRAGMGDPVACPRPVYFHAEHASPVRSRTKPCQDKKRFPGPSPPVYTASNNVFSPRNVTCPDLSGQKAKLQLRWGQEEQNEEENGEVLKTGA